MHTSSGHRQSAISLVHAVSVRGPPRPKRNILAVVDSPLYYHRFGLAHSATDTLFVHCKMIPIEQAEQRTSQIKYEDRFFAFASRCHVHCAQPRPIQEFRFVLLHPCPPPLTCDRFFFCCCLFPLTFFALHFASFYIIWSAKAVCALAMLRLRLLCCCTQHPRLVRASMGHNLLGYVRLWVFFASALFVVLLLIRFYSPPSAYFLRTSRSSFAPRGHVSPLAGIYSSRIYDDTHCSIDNRIYFQYVTCSRSPSRHRQLNGRTRWKPMEVECNCIRCSCTIHSH